MDRYRHALRSTIMATPFTAKRRRLMMTMFGAAVAFAVTGPAHAAANFSGQTLNTPNFAHQDLTGANFTGATLIGAVFIRATLTGAHFDGATFKAVPGHPTQTNDFTQAYLSDATFTGAMFQSPTYFTYANIDCADFSSTVLNNGNAVFGDNPRKYSTPASPSCRTKFRGATMNCEFIDDWFAFDLTNADVSACITKLSGRSFTGAIMDGINLTNAILDGSQFVGTSLIQATLSGVSLQCLNPTSNAPTCVDMTGAHLEGAILDNANLTGANLYNALLSTYPPRNIFTGATLRNAHLKNVNLSGATLSGADFTSANFYGSNPGSCPTTKGTSGFTKMCASAFGATIADTTFVNAYLYGVDFGGATITGTNFNDAVVTGANFASTTMGPDTRGKPTAFVGAYMQGTNLDQAKQLLDVDLTNAFFDFKVGGNTIDINLDGGTHNSFACSTPSTCTPPSPTDVCVQDFYAQTTVPFGTATMRCPSGQFGPCGNPAVPAFTANWKSKLIVDMPDDPGPPKGWYYDNATFTPSTDKSAMCNGKGDNSSFSSW